jgi:hypothetical protein
MVISKLWLFKPSMRLSYMTPTPYVLPHMGCVHAAKVLYKIVGPYLALADLKRFVFFPLFPLWLIPFKKRTGQVSRLPTGGIPVLSDRCLPAAGKFAQGEQHGVSKERAHNDRT